MNRMIACIFSIAFALFASGAPSQAADSSIYDELGGHQGMVKIVDASMTNFLSDDRIKHHFDEVDIDWLKGKLVEQFCQLAGGPCVYKGHDMHTVHEGMHLSDAEFNALVEDLQKGMETCDVPFRAQNRFLALLAPFESQVVTR